MAITFGIVGLPNVGKSTLFNALANASAAAEDYPFCTIEPNIGIVNVPDPRLQAIADIVSPQKIIPTTMQIVDIAGLIAGASQGEGLGNQFLGHIRETQAIAMVVRCFPKKNDKETDLDPISDIETIQTELMLADLETVTKAIDRVSRQRNKGIQDKQVAHMALLEKIQHALEAGQLAQSLDLDEKESLILKQYHLLTAKPILYVANVAEKQTDHNPHVTAVIEFAKRTQSPYLAICAHLEAALADLNSEEKKLLLEDLQWQEPGLNRFIQAAYQRLGLQTFFTAGPKEVRAWTVKKGATAPQAAGVIHTDFERGFIRAEVIGYEDYIHHQGEQKAKEAGAWRVEGKQYIIKDGDVVYFRHAT